MKYVPYSALDGIPNIIVDGAAHKDTELVLSHWANSGMRSEWLRDTSSEIVLDYLQHQSIPKHIQAVSNNHYDQDGLVSIFSITEPQLAQMHRELLIDIAEAGDFGRYKEEKAVKITMTIANMIKPEAEYFDSSVFSKPYQEMTAIFYQETLKLFPKMLENIDAFRSLWEEEFAFLSHSVALVRENKVLIEEDVENDIVVVTIPIDLENRYSQQHNGTHFGGVHEFAIHNASRRARVFYIHGQKVQFKYRYETWVKLRNNIHPLRINLSPLADKLTQQDSVNWIYDGSENIVPLLHIGEDKATSLSTHEILTMIKNELQSGETDWNPYPDH